MLAYCLLTEFPPVGAIKATENKGALCALTLVNRIGRILEAAT